MSVKRNVLIVLALCLMLVLQGCSGGSSGGGQKNNPPKITSHLPAETELTAVIGEEITFSVTASDPDGDQLAYSWKKSGPGTLNSGNSRTAKWTAPQEEGEATVSVTVSDGKSGVASVTWKIQISSVKPPIITSPDPVTSKSNPLEVNVNEERVLSITTSDPAGLSLTSQWSCTKGEIKDPQRNTAKWVAPDTPGEAQVTVTVSNGYASTTHTWYFDVQGNVVYVRENIVAPTKWATGNIYVIEDNKTIYVQSTLTIDKGAIVKLGQNARLVTNSSGRVEAVGTSSNPIVFTSLRDDLHGGDTNKDSDTTQPNSGDWSQIYLDSKNGNKFEYCEFYFGGGGTGQKMLDLNESVDTVVRNCTFAFSKGTALSAVFVPSATIVNNIFYNNEKPLAINVDLSLDDSNRFSNPNDPTEMNQYQAIIVDSWGGSYVTKAITWAETEAAFVLSGGYFVVEDEAKLTLGPGTTIKLHNNRLDIEGLLEAKGTNFNPIVFTSLNDNDYGGESNGPNASAPAPGDWEYLYIGDNARAIFDYCIFRYGGTKSDRAEGDAALCEAEFSSGMQIANSVFAENLRALDMASPNSTISNSMFIGNDFPLCVALDIDTDDSLTIVNNKYDAIYVIGSNWRYYTNKPHVRWENTQVPYVLNEDVSFYGSALDLGDGTIIRVWQNKEISLHEGSAIIDFDKAVFTSSRDTQRGGDVGAPPIAPAPGDWVGIYDERIAGYISAPNIYFAAKP